jgi:hypothetical protein
MSLVCHLTCNINCKTFLKVVYFLKIVQLLCVLAYMGIIKCYNCYMLETAVLPTCWFRSFLFVCGPIYVLVYPIVMGHCPCVSMRLLGFNRVYGVARVF